MDLFWIEKWICHKDFFVIRSKEFTWNWEIKLVVDFWFVDFVFVEQCVDWVFEDLFALFGDFFTQLVFYDSNERI